jgi:DNA-binding response OmpR family regulator
MLVADEDPTARAALESIVDSRVSPTLCVDGAEALWQAGRLEPAVVILSATLPGVSAADVASVLVRHAEGPRTIMVGVGVGEADRAAPVLAAGASSVVSRPYRSAEIEPMLRTHLARMEQRRHETETVAVGALQLDGLAYEVVAAGRKLSLPLREFELLRLLMLHAGDVVSRAHIRQQIWEARGESVTSNTIAVHVRRLRGQLDGVAVIDAVRGVGYKLVGPDCAGRGERLTPVRSAPGGHHT